MEPSARRVGCSTVAQSKSCARWTLPRIHGAAAGWCCRDLHDPFPTGEGRWQVSRGGGEGPVWPKEADHDSKQFVMIKRGTKAGSQPVRWVFVQNWPADLVRTR